MRKILSFLLLLLILLCELPAAALKETEAPAQTGAPVQTDVQTSGDGASVSGNNWMSHISDDTKINMINIPGTHDSATDRMHFGEGCTQYHQVKTQLNFGVRFFDIRVGVCHDGIYWKKWRRKPKKYWLEIFHGDSKAGYRFDTIMDWCRDFLKANPGETIVMSIKEDPDTPKYYKYNTQTLLMDAYSKYRDIFYINTPGSQEIAYIPTLKEVRGKIVLVRRYAAKQDSQKVGINAKEGWPNDSYNYYHVPNTNYDIYVQDCYQFDYGCRDSKYDCWKNGVNSIKKRRNAGADFLSFNHSSGFIKPYRVEYMADYMNCRIQSFYEREAVYPLGIVPMDCIRDKHARAIYLQNKFSKSVNIHLSLDGQSLSGEATLQIAYNGGICKGKDTGGGKYYFELPDGVSGSLKVYLRGEEIGTISVSSQNTNADFELFTVSYQKRSNEEGEPPKDQQLYRKDDIVGVISEAGLRKTDGNPAYLLGFSMDANAGAPMRMFLLEGKSELYAVWAVQAGEINIGSDGVTGLWLREENGQREYRTREDQPWLPLNASPLSSAITLKGTNPSFRVYVQSGSFILALDNVNISNTSASADSNGILQVTSGASLELILAPNSNNTLETSVGSDLPAVINVAGELTLRAPASSDGQALPCGILNARAQNGGAGIAFVGGSAENAGKLYIESGRLNAEGTGAHPNGSSAIGISGRAAGGSQQGLVTINGGTVNAKCANDSNIFAIGAKAADSEQAAVSVVINGGSITGGVYEPQNSKGTKLQYALLGGEASSDTRQSISGFTPQYYNAFGVYGNENSSLLFYIPDMASGFYNETTGKFYYKKTGINSYIEAKLYVDTLNRRIFALGNDITAAAGAESGRTVLKIDGAEQDLDVYGIPSDGRTDYDLSEYSLFGGLPFLINNAPTSANVAIEGGVLDAVYGGGLISMDGNLSVVINGGKVNTVCASGLGETDVDGTANVEIHGGTVTQGVYAAYDYRQTFTHPVTLSIGMTNANPRDLSGAEIGLLQAETDDNDLSAVNVDVSLANCGECSLMQIDMYGGTDASRHSVALGNSDKVELAGVLPMDGVTSLSVPSLSTLTLSNSAAFGPDVGSFSGGGELILAEDIFVGASLLDGTRPVTTLKPLAPRENLLLFTAPTGTDNGAFTLSGPLGTYFELLPVLRDRVEAGENGTTTLVTEKCFVLMRKIGVEDKKIFLCGNDILIKAGGQAGKTLLYYAAYPTTPITLSGVDGDVSSGYNLSEYTIFGGGVGGDGSPAYSSTNIIMEGGVVDTLYAGGKGAAGSDGVIHISGGSIKTVYAGGADGDRITGNVQVTISNGSIGRLYVGGNGAKIGGAASAICSDGVINEIHVGDKSEGGSIKKGASLTLTGSSSVPNTPLIKGANGTSSREVIFSNWYVNDMLSAAECPNISDIEAVRLRNNSNTCVSAGSRMKNVKLLELDDSAIWVKCGDLSVGALQWMDYGEEADSDNHEVGIIAYENRGQSLKVGGTISGVFVLTPAPDARLGDVVLRSPHAYVKDFYLDSESFILLKNGNTLILGNNNSGGGVSDYTRDSGKRYMFIEKGVWQKDGSLTFTVDADCERFVSVSVDGVPLERSEYTVKCGSTIVNIHKSYLDKLKPGEHILRVQFTDGYAQSLFTTLKNSALTVTPVAEIPATGGNGSVAVLFILLACVVAVLRKRRIIGDARS